MSLSLKTVLADTRIDSSALKAMRNMRRVPMGMKGAGRWHKLPVAMSIVNADSLTDASAMRVKADTGPRFEKITYVTVRKFDKLKGIVEGLVYEPNVLDSQGEFMTAEDLETLAHRFLSLDLTSAIDTQHSMMANGSYPVESFIARKGDPDYPEGGWVMAVQLTDELAEKVESGEINGFSFAALVKHTDVAVEYSTLRDHVGPTQKADNHEHIYFVQMDENGRITGGKTDEVDGHVHAIKRGSVTEVAMGHSHRYFVE